MREFLSILEPSDYIAAAAAFVALLALGTTIWQMRQAHRHNRLSVRPRVRFQWRLTPERSLPIGLEIANEGNGPAIIRRFAIHVDDQLVPTTLESGGWHEAITEKILSKDSGGYRPMALCWEWFTPGDTLRTGSRVMVLGFTPGNWKDADLDWTTAALRRIEVAVDYSSMYEEKFSARSGTYGGRPPDH